MDLFYNPFDMRDFYHVSRLSFRDYVTAITSKRRKPKTIKRKKKSKKYRR